MKSEHEAPRLVLRGEHVLLRPFREDELDELVQQAEASPAYIGGKPSRERLANRIESSGLFVEGRLELAVEFEETLAGSIQARGPRRRFHQASADSGSRSPIGCAGAESAPSRSPCLLSICSPTVTRACRRPPT